MNPLTMFGFFGSFALGGSIASVLVRSRLSTILLLVAAPILIALNFVFLMAMPFPGQMFEVVAIGTSAVAMSLPMTLFFKAGEKLKKDRPNVAFKDGRGTRKPELLGIAAIVLVLPAVAITMTTLISRLNEAAWLQWKCDGPIVAVTRNKGNHNNPMLVVETAGVAEKFEMVDGGLWSRAKPGQRLTKPAGSPMATLDGEPVRMVPRQASWWNEPK